MDLVSAGIAYFTVREAGKPADADHPFGHGKIETLSSLFEALLLLIAAGLIVYEAIERFFRPQEFLHPAFAMGTILVSLVVSFVMYRHNSRAARQTDSSALHVNALHFLSDAIASLGILAGLALLRLTGWTPIDSIMALAVAAYILAISFSQVRRALLELSDTQLPEEELLLIRKVLSTFRGRMIDAHDLRTRKSGATRHVDFHLVVCRGLTVEASHALCDEIESTLAGQIPHASVNIHVEPCEHLQTNCFQTCQIYRKAKS